jgi:hypothetical protein
VGHNKCSKKFYSDKKNKELTENSLEEYLETRRFLIQI